ncbi:ArsR family transcriptional regulator [Pyrococcus kukulkanii]|uniref:ArsR family transcriptional regulator n=1 Tax=Pyrococcus kukulkanii TaxID=1609559 RepID=A0A127B8E8_9EURY|nr:ArsR family transcriptional regulator [Pyrococcus kukulkanii]AMM53641.1 ArsR family transcriptional regulator [Pyrococcus kukulkanii]
MKHLKILKVLESGEKSEEEIAKVTGLSRLETRRFLLRLAEQGKVESFQKEGKIFWKIREKKPEEEEFKYL